MRMGHNGVEISVELPSSAESSAEDATGGGEEASKLG